MASLLIDTFQNKIACAERSLDFSCPSRQRILIYSAFFGTSTHIPPECANNTISNQLLKVHQTTNYNRKPFKEYCQIKQATKLVADRCHTQSNCSIQAQFEQFQLPDCVNELTNDEKQTQVHLKVTYACVQNEVLRTNLIGSSSSNSLSSTTTGTISNTILNTFQIGSSLNERKNHRSQTNNKTKEFILNPLNEQQFNTPMTSNSINNRPELTDFQLVDNSLLPTNDLNTNSNRNTLYDHQQQNTVHPSDHNDDNLPAAVRSQTNNQQSSWPNNQLNELPTDFKTHISNPNQSRSIEPFKDWNSFCQYIESK